MALFRHFAGTAIQLLCQYGPATTPVADVILQDPAVQSLTSFVGVMALTRR